VSLLQREAGRALITFPIKALLPFSVLISSTNFSIAQNHVDDDKSTYEFCHHCKQLKNRFLLASCNYDSSKMGPTIPVSYHIKDVQIYNSESFVLI